MVIKASVIIANNLAHWSFPKQVLGPGLEVIVVNNGINEPGNPCRARNYGARKAKGKYLVFLDNDVTVKKGFLNKAINYLDQHPKVGAGLLKLLRSGTNKFDSAGELITANGFLVERARRAEDQGQFDKADKIFSGKGAGLVIRKEVFNRIGGFDENYVYYWEEPDLLWRVWQAGYEVRFLWMAKAYHDYGTKLKPIPKQPAAGQVYLACRNQLMTIIKNAQKYRLRMLFWVSLSWLGLEIMFVIKGKWQQAWAIERAWWWLLRHWPKQQAKGDDQWLKQVMIKQDWQWYLGKCLAYISGKEF
ncbi:MAG: Glycosyl transferase family 2 [Candidatus Beckwithbacteria bacterium GW2011_GWA2_43_10]|uniref:Glycosyl transferase family 2 n=1 Tax=Candidatus Beckwithbacteria bacterium GW2011_GWA2_43_10 TaxID=1618369 RepID=A0A0G1EY64_9BACT|nr:MAG: Glycosyl transferase family 2 [Candidatus Beckwithbacteria bacterium GW2011_GWA2_43_10]